MFFLVGIFILKVDILCFFFKRYVKRLILSSYMNDFILVVLEKEKEKLKVEFYNVKKVFIIFDEMV